MRTNLPLLSYFPNQQVQPPLQPSAVNPPPLPHILSLSLQRYLPPLQPLAVHATPPPPLSVSLHG